MNARPQIFFQILVATLLSLAAVDYVSAGDFPGGKPDRRIIKTQEKVDDLFEKGDFERAYFIYREELVPLGDKFAQYMVGYMHVAGKGTEQDYIAGSAWYRLAAERGGEHYSKARDELLGHFNEEQLLRSNQKYTDLRLLYSDAMIICRLIEEDLEIAASRVPGSKLAYRPTDVTSINNAERARLAEDAIERIETRLVYLRAALGSDAPMSDEEIIRIERVEQEAARAIQ